MKMETPLSLFGSITLRQDVMIHRRPRIGGDPATHRILRRRLRGDDEGKLFDRGGIPKILSAR